MHYELKQIDPSAVSQTNAMELERLKAEYDKLFVDQVQE